MALRNPITRRRLLRALGLGAVGVVGARVLLPRLWRTGAVGEADEETIEFVHRCFDGIVRSRMVDTHVHVAGQQQDKSGCWLNPAMRSHLHPTQRLRYELFMGGAGVERASDGDEAFVARLIERHNQANADGRLLLLAFDWFHGDDGKADPARSAIHVPDDYVLDLARRHDQVLACASIHPYAEDAIVRLERVRERGAVAVKWLPNAQNIDGTDLRTRRFARRLAELGMPLITHAGDESALAIEDLAELGNPLRLRPLLDEGATVVVAHAGSLGSCRDLDNAPRSIECFDAFLRLFHDEQYERNLIADISGLTFINRCGRPLLEMVLAGDQHHRLVNGSDYPLVGVDPIVSTRLLQYRGYLDGEDRRLCEKVFDVNPLLFDFCVKRSLRVNEGGRVYRFSPTVFETDWLFETLH